MILASQTFAQSPVQVRPATPEQSGDEKMAAGQFADAVFYYKTQWSTFMVGRNDSDADTLMARERLAGKMAAALAKIDKPPAIPDEAEFHGQKGRAFVELAKTPADFGNFPKAVKEFQDAVNLAPWVFNYHFNLAVAYKSAGQFNMASNSLKLAKALAPNDGDRRDTLKLRAEIEASQEMAAAAKVEAEKAANSPEARAAKEKEAAQRFIASVEDAKYVCREYRTDDDGHRVEIDIRNGKIIGANIITWINPKLRPGVDYSSNAFVGFRGLWPFGSDGEDIPLQGRVTVGRYNNGETRIQISDDRLVYVSQLLFAGHSSPTVYPAQTCIRTK